MHPTQSKNPAVQSFATDGHLPTEAFADLPFAPTLLHSFVLPSLVKRHSCIPVRFCCCITPDASKIGKMFTVAHTQAHCCSGV